MIPSRAPTRGRPRRATPASDPIDVLIKPASFAADLHRDQPRTALPETTEERTAPLESYYASLDGDTST